MISVLIVDDHEIVRCGLKLILKAANDIEVVGEAKSGDEAIQLVRNLKPDVVLMDVQMPGGISGLETTKRILHIYPKLKVIALTSHDEDPFPANFLHIGAAGYLTKKSNPDELITAIRNVNSGNTFITSSIAQRLAAEHGKISKTPFSKLSPRELEALLMILSGEEVKRIASKMNVTFTTISSYRMSIFKKLNIKNDIELVYLAYTHGLIDDIKLDDKKDDNE